MRDAIEYRVFTKESLRTGYAFFSVVPVRTGEDITYNTPTGRVSGTVVKVLHAPYPESPALYVTP